MCRTTNILRNSLVHFSGYFCDLDHAHLFVVSELLMVYTYIVHTMWVYIDITLHY